MIQKLTANGSEFKTYSSQYNQDINIIRGDAGPVQIVKSGTSEQPNLFNTGISYAVEPLIMPYLNTNLRSNMLSNLDLNISVTNSIKSLIEAFPKLNFEAVLEKDIENPTISSVVIKLYSNETDPEKYRAIKNKLRSIVDENTIGSVFIFTMVQPD